VSTDTLSLNDLPGIATSVGNLFENALVPLVQPEVGVVPTIAAKQISAAMWHSVLQAMGVTNADAITSAKSFEFPEDAGIYDGLPEETEEEPEAAEIEPWMLDVMKEVMIEAIADGNGQDPTA